MSILDLGVPRVAGLDIGSHCVKIAEVRRAKQGWQVCRAAHLRAPPAAPTPVLGPIRPPKVKPQIAADSSGTPLATAVRLALQNSGIKARRVVCSLPGSAAVIRYFRFPHLSPKELAGAVRLEAEQVIPFDIHEVELDYQVLPETAAGRGGMAGVMVAALRSSVDERVGVARSAGLDVAAVDSDTLALVNCFTEAGPELDGQAVGIVNIGAHTANLGILRKGGLHFCRDISLGGANLSAALSERSGLPTAEMEELMHGGTANRVVEIGGGSSNFDELLRQVFDPLITELKQSTTHYVATERISGVRRIYLCGGASKLPQLRAVIAEGVDIPTEDWNPLEHVTLEPEASRNVDILSQGPSMAIALGLAMRRDT